jgi:hypothetical protein
LNISLFPFLSLLHLIFQMIFSCGCASLLLLKGKFLV